jgi:hypothetical protein
MYLHSGAGAAQVSLGAESGAPRLGGRESVAERRTVCTVNTGDRSTGGVDMRLQKSFDYAIEVTKQLLTLGTAVLALTVTVGVDVGRGRHDSYLLTAWAAFFISIICGIWTLFALMTEFAPRQGHGDDPLPSVRSWRVRGPSFVQIVAFAIGTALLVLYGYAVFKHA